MRAAALLPCLSLLLGSCGATGPGVEDGPAPRELPPRWSEMEPFAFERLLEAAFAGGAPRPFGRTAQAELFDTLAGEGDAPVRAAVLLAQSRHPSSADLLLRRLELRVEGPERGSDAGDVVAAAAIPRFPSGPAFLPRLEALAVGHRPHPDLEVRVECACAALELGSDRPIPFLLQVLRIDTWAGEGDARDFTPSATTAWARGRAALALSRRAGIPAAYEPDASIEDRETEAARLERILLQDR